VKSRVKSVHLVIPGFNDFRDRFGDETYLIRTMIEGVILGNYTFDKYKSESGKPEKISFILHYNNRELLGNSIARSVKIMDGVCLARDLVNEPANRLTPLELARRTKTGLSKTGVKVEIFDEKELKKRKMKAILAVAGASVNSHVSSAFITNPQAGLKRR